MKKYRDALYIDGQLCIDTDTHTYRYTDIQIYSDRDADVHTYRYRYDQSRLLPLPPCLYRSINRSPSSPSR